MNNRINPYRNNLIHSFRQPAQRSEAPARDAGIVREAGVPTETPRATKPVGTERLSQVEQQMIERYFPKSEAMTLRLYGINGSTETVNPGADGGHLDVRG